MIKTLLYFTEHTPFKQNTFLDNGTQTCRFIFIIYVAVCALKCWFYFGKKYHLCIRNWTNQVSISCHYCPKKIYKRKHEANVQLSLFILTDPAGRTCFRYCRLRNASSQGRQETLFCHGTHLLEQHSKNGPVLLAFHEALKICVRAKDPEHGIEPFSCLCE